MNDDRRIGLSSDYAAHAKSRLPAAVWHYLQDGDIGRNDRALSAWDVVPRPLVDVRGGSTAITLFGESLDHPVLLAPVAYQRLFHAGGEAACAAAAAAQGGQMVVSSLASQSFAEIAQAANAVEGASPWFQLYWQGNREATARLLDRAFAAGLSTVVLTLDAPIKRAVLALPATVRAVNLDVGESHVKVDPGAGEVFDGWMAQAPTWGDVDWLRNQVGKRPLVLKGVLHPDDAERAVAVGCDGIVVSNHGHRVLSAAPASIRSLERIARRIDGRVPLLFDGGVRSGTDVFIALALGASGVLIGRPAIWGLAAEGAVGVARVIRLLRDELEMTMALAGCTRIADITSDCVDRDPDRTD